MSSLKFVMTFHIAVLFLCSYLTSSQYVGDDIVVRGGEFDSKPTGPADEDEGSGNSVVVLGVTLCLSVIVAIAGIFIGVYFHVERFCCCCCNKEDKSNVERGDDPLYGSDNVKGANVFMTGTSNTAFTHDEEKASDSNLSPEDNNNAKKNDTIAASAPRRKPFFPPTSKKKKKKARETTLIVDDPIAFGSSTTHVTEDGTIVRSTDKDSLRVPSRKVRQNQNNETTYKSFSTQQDDILF